MNCPRLLRAVKITLWITFVTTLAVLAAYNYPVPLLLNGVIILLWVLIAAASRVPRRFSLRTLLIAMTLLAVGMGIVVYFTRAPAAPPINVGDFGR
jgi:hypothetical protein